MVTYSTHPSATSIAISIVLYLFILALLFLLTQLMACKSSQITSDKCQTYVSSFSSLALILCQLAPPQTDQTFSKISPTLKHGFIATGTDTLFYSYSFCSRDTLVVNLFCPGSLSATVVLNNFRSN